RRGRRGRSGIPACATSRASIARPAALASQRCSGRCSAPDSLRTRLPQSAPGSSIFSRGRGPMPTLKLSQTIDRPASAVFAVIVDVANLARWNPTIKSARKLSEGEPGEGTRFEMEVQGFGNVPQTLEEVHRDRSARYVPHFKAMSGGHRFLLTAEGE